MHTVQFSNHTGYEAWTGEIFTAAHLALVWSGLKLRGCAADCQAVLSGYLGSVEIGSFITQTVDEIKAVHPEALYCCDPVMGDYGRGLFVDGSISTFISGQAVPAADIVTPNQFEAEEISGSVIASIDDAKRACDIIHEMGPSIVLITSFKPNDQSIAEISMFLSSHEGYRVLTTPELSFDPPLHGSGDLTSALFLGHYLFDKDPVAALELMGDSVYAVFERTCADAARELSLVHAQEEIAHPKRRFEARRV